LASFAIFAVGGTAFFMMRETFAICVPPREEGDEVLVE
jgi:hypothetical protein